MKLLSRNVLVPPWNSIASVGGMVNFARFYGTPSGLFDQRSTLEWDEAGLESRSRSDQLERIMAKDASCSSEAWRAKDRINASSKKTRDLARSLVASEADASKASLQTEPATVRVYEKLRRQLGSPMGVDGFQALASRALALAKSQSPWLGIVQVRRMETCAALAKLNLNRARMKMTRPGSF